MNPHMYAAAYSSIMDNSRSSALYDSRSKAILTVTVTFLVILAISVYLRCFVRTRVVQAFRWDDTLMVLAMVGFDFSLWSTWSSS